jgi:hypothetical protein
MVVGNKMLENRETCFLFYNNLITAEFKNFQKITETLFNAIYGHPLIGSKFYGPRASYFQQPISNKYQVCL